MAREEFLLSLRTAVGYLAQTNGVRLDSPHLEELLRRAPNWLTPRAVAGFEAGDFGELSVEDQERLREGVDRFLRVASRVSPAAPVPASAVDEALPALLLILSVMRPYLEAFRIYYALRRQEFPDYVRDFAVRVGEDSTGDPAIWLWVIVDDRVAGRELTTKVPEVRELVRKTLAREGVDKYFYLMFRTESEQRELEEVALQ